MNVVVAGGGHMGTHLVARLVAEGHETVVIDIDPRVTEKIFAELGVVVITGSATDMNVLEQAGIKRADVAVAMTGRDSDNLSFCLLSRYFGVPRVLARMLNPQYEVPYRLVGATKIHNEAEILVHSFLTSIEYPEIGALMQVGKGDLVVFEVRIPFGSPVAGRTIVEIVRSEDFPARCVFIAVESKTGEVNVPEGSTRIEGDSHVILAAHRPDLPQLLRCLTLEKGAAAGEQTEMLQTLSLAGFLSGVSKEDLAGLAVGARFDSSKKGEILYHQGDQADRLYILRKGAVELESRGGARTVLQAPACFGEMSGFTGEPRAQTARVIEEADLLILDSSAFRSVLLQNPFLALELAKSLGERAGDEAETA